MGNEKDSRDPLGQIINHHETQNDNNAETNYLSEEESNSILAHVEKHIGPVPNVMHEIVSDALHIDLLLVPPTEQNNYYTVVTMGMSALPMNIPDGIDAPRYAELVIALPPEWSFEFEGKNSEEHYWPLGIMKFLSRLPCMYDTWLGHWHTIPNGDPAQPYAANTKLSGMMITPTSNLYPEEFEYLKVSADKEVVFLYCTPLYSEEMDLKLEEGADALIDAFIDADTPIVLDLKRKNVAKIKKGLWGLFKK